MTHIGLVKYGTEFRCPDTLHCYHNRLHIFINSDCLQTYNTIVSSTKNKLKKETYTTMICKSFKPCVKMKIKQGDILAFQKTIFLFRVLRWQQKKLREG